MILAESSAYRSNGSPATEADTQKDLLRFTTAGSVDDGKSTLIGRLLHDSKAVYEDQIAAVRNSRVNRSGGAFDFALLTDGLRAEREQGITIDVAYRYFETARRKFIIADTPGHEQYTRNMATGASTADAAVILIDATSGVLPQTRRHAYIAALLAIPNVIAAVNKLDLAGYSQEVFERLRHDFLMVAQQVGLRNVTTIPISALAGDNVVSPTERMPWYQGPTLLQHLESVPPRAAVDAEPFRFPVQYVIRPDANFRGFAGQVSSGMIRPGGLVKALPSGQMTRVQSIVTYDGDQPQASFPMSVTLTLEDEIDLSRGEMLVSPEDPPDVSRHFDAEIVWFDAKPLELEHSYLLKHAVRTSRVKAHNIRYRVNMNTLTHEPAQQLQMNDIAEVEFEAASPLFFDTYDRNRITGSFILIDPLSNATVGAAMIRRNLRAKFAALPGKGAGVASVGHGRVILAERERRHGHHPAVILAQGRADFAVVLERALFEHGFEVLLLDAQGQEPAITERLAKLALSVGLIVIYSGSKLGTGANPAHPVFAEALAQERVIDLDALELAGTDEAALSKVLPIIERLRINDYSGTGFAGNRRETNRGEGS